MSSTKQHTLAFPSKQECNLNISILSLFRIVIRLAIPRQESSTIITTVHKNNAILSLRDATAKSCDHLRFSCLFPSIIIMIKNFLRVSSKVSWFNSVFPPSSFLDLWSCGMVDSTECTHAISQYHPACQIDRFHPQIGAHVPEEFTHVFLLGSHPWLSPVLQAASTCSARSLSSSVRPLVSR